MTLLINIFRYLPDRWQITLKQLKFAWMIRTGHFITDEPEFSYIESIVHAGDNVIDIGASVGVYTLRLSKLVGTSGRVYAFEPVPESFYLLTINTGLCSNRNISLINMAISDKPRIATMTIPRSGNHLRNYYLASIADPKLLHSVDSVQVFCFPLDLFTFPSRIRLVKIDVEGHEEAVLNGMMDLIERDKPTLIIETVLPGMSEWLISHGYQRTNLAGSPNTIFECIST
jgi:FkbM family methyltransferase